MKKILLHLFSALAAASLLVSAPRAAAEEPAAPTQGDVAVLLAQKLGFFVGLTRPPTPQEAIRLLMENKISPFGGWQAGELLSPEDFARILVQALGREGQIPEEERNNPETAAYKDLLVAEFDFDIEAILEEIKKLRPSPNPLGTGPLGEAASTDPLKGRGEGGDQVMGGAPGNFFIPVTLPVVQKALQTIPPVRRPSSSGQVDDNQQDGTPSTPPVPTPVPPGPTPTPFT